MSPDTAADPAALERRRRLSLRAAAIFLVIAAIGFPLGMRVGGSENRDAVGGALILSALAGIIAAPWIVRAWQSFMGRRMIAAVAAGRSGIRYIDGDRDQRGAAAALSSEAFALGAFRDSGLVEAFESAGVRHVLTGTADGVPFAITDLALLDGKGYRMFGGVLASFRLSRPRPGLTIVARDRGLLGNLLSRVGSSVERLPLEDPAFEGTFEVYGTDQVGGRVTLTTTMLERLKELDRVAHARGFSCAFLDQHLLIALSGAAWRCPAWRILSPVEQWLPRYAAWLGQLVDLPVEIVRTLNLDVRPLVTTRPFTPVVRPAPGIESPDGQVFSSPLFRLIGEGGMALAYVASGSIFGGLALSGAWYGITEGYFPALFWYLWGLTAAGILYGAYAVGLGLRELGRLAWRWNAPLRTLRRPVDRQ